MCSASGAGHTAAAPGGSGSPERSSKRQSKRSKKRDKPEKPSEKKAAARSGAGAGVEAPLLGINGGGWAVEGWPMGVSHAGRPTRRAAAGF